MARMPRISLNFRKDCFKIKKLKIDSKFIIYNSILGLDYGVKRIGLAVSDPGGKMALPLKILENNKSLVRELLNVIQERKIEAIVIGLPLDFSGKDTAMTKKVRIFAKKIKLAASLPVFFEKELLTTKIAKPYFSKKEIERHYKLYRHKPRQVSGIKESKQADDSAAALILQSFLDKRL